MSFAAGPRGSHTCWTLLKRATSWSNLVWTKNFAATQTTLKGWEREHFDQDRQSCKERVWSSVGAWCKAPLHCAVASLNTTRCSGHQLKRWESKQCWTIGITEKATLTCVGMAALRETCLLGKGRGALDMLTCVSHDKQAVQARLVPTRESVRLVEEIHPSS